MSKFIEEKLEQAFIELFEKDGGIQVTLFKAEDVKSIDVEGGEIGGEISGEIVLTKRQKDVIELILENKNITIDEMANSLGIKSTSTVEKHIKNLRDKGVIDRIGGTRGYWKVLRTN